MSYTPFGHQQTILDAILPKKITIAGRRSGKTLLDCLQAVKWAMEGVVK